MAENGGSRGDLANWREAGKLSYRLSPVPAITPHGLATDLQLPAPWSGNWRRKAGITQKVCFFFKAAAMQSPLGQRGAAADDSGNDEDK